jgi:hypothetical protein
MGFHQIRDTGKPQGILKGHSWQSDEYLYIYGGLTRSDICGMFMRVARIAGCLQELSWQVSGIICRIF